MFANFMKSTPLSIIIINLVLISITHSDQTKKKQSDCNLCKTLLPPCCDNNNCDKCRTNVQNVDGRNYVVTYVPAIIPYNSDGTLNQKPNVKARLLPMDNLKVGNNDKNVHGYSENVPALIYQPDVQIKQPIITLPRLQQHQQLNRQFVPFSYWNINADNIDFVDVSDSDYQMASNSGEDNQHVPVIINTSVTKAHRPKLNKAKKVQTNYIKSKLPSPPGKVLKKKPTIKYPVQIDGVTYIVTPGKHPQVVIANENAYKNPAVNKPPPRPIINTYVIPSDIKPPNQITQFHVNAASMPNDDKKMPMQLNDYGIHDYNIPADENFPLYDYPIIDEKIAQNVQPYQQSKIPINAYHPIIPPENLMKLSIPYIRITPDADVNIPGKLPTVYLDNPVLPTPEKVKYPQVTNADELTPVQFIPSPLPVKTSGATDPGENAYHSVIHVLPDPQQIKQPPINYNKDPVNAYSTPIIMPRIDELPNIKSDMLPLVQNMPKPPIQSHDDGKLSNDQLPVQLNATGVNADNSDSNQPTIDFFINATGVNADNSDSNQTTVDNADNNTTPSANAELLSPQPYGNEESIPFYDAYVNGRNGDNDDNLTESTGNNRFGDFIDWFDYFNNEEKVDRIAPNKGFIFPRPINVKNKKKENARGKVGKVYNITGTVNYTEKVTNVEDENAKVEKDENVKSVNVTSVGDENAEVEKDENVQSVKVISVKDENAEVESDENVQSVKVTETVEEDNYDETDENAKNKKKSETAEEYNYDETDENAKNKKKSETAEEYNYDETDENAKNKVSETAGEYNYYESEENAQNSKATESGTNIEETNGDKSYIEDYNVESAGFVEPNEEKLEVPSRPIQPVLVTVVKNTDKKTKVIHKTIPISNIFTTIFNYFTQHKTKIPNNIGVTADMMNNDKLYQTVKATNFKSLKKLGLLMLHLLKYMNADRKMTPGEIIEHTIADVNNEKTDGLITKDPEIIAYIGWKLIDSTNAGADNLKMTKTLKMIMMKVLDDERFSELKSFLNGNKSHPTVTHVQSMKYQKKCLCKLVPVGEP